jgi:plastocyanin
MATILTQPRVTRRAPLSALTKLTIASLFGFVGVLVYAQTILVGQFSLQETIFALVLLFVAGLIARGWRWSPLLGALISALIIGSNPAIIINDLTHPEAFHFFVSVLVAVAIAVVGIIAGISATIQNYRSQERRTPRVMVPALVALATFCLGATLVGALPRETSSGVSPEMLAALPAIVTPEFHFDQTKITTKVGTTTALRLDNPHSAQHSFDVDEINVHVPVAPGKQSLILFTPTTPGSYTFYCAIPGHRELGMEGTLVVEP